MQSTSTSTVAIAPELAETVHSLATAGTSHDHVATACLNCNTLVPDRYCGHCG